MSELSGGEKAIAVDCIGCAVDVTGKLRLPTDSAFAARDASDAHAVSVATLALANAPLGVVI